MNTAPAGLDIRPLTIPASADGPEAEEFREMVRVRNLVYAEISGHDDHAITPGELLPAYAPDPDEVRHVWVVALDGRFVGRVGLDVPQEAGSHVAYGLIELERAVWGRGVGSAASDLLEETARSHGRRVLQTWVEHPASAGPRLAPPTGFGDIPRDHAARFLLNHGYTLEQVERASALDLTDPAVTDRLREHLETATAAAAGYRVVQWTLPTPPEFVDGYAWMKSRMVTDAPSAGLEFDEETWDADRLRRHERVYLDAGRRMQVTAAQHLDSGDLVAFNELVIGTDPTAASHQEDTLVSAPHRGHRLGMLVKAAGLLAWREAFPASPRVLTYNAEENRPMLGINEALGFAPISYEGAWKKVLEDR
jgi:GNAT superfamily N-acetyltransferase